MKFATQTIHGGIAPDKDFGAIINPIYQTSTYLQSAPGKYKKYDYTRAGNPNFESLEKTLAVLEQAKFGTIFSSGLGALTAIVSTLKSHDKVVAVNDLYGGTYRLFQKVFKQFGVELELIDFQDLVLAKKRLTTRPKMIFLESPTNPLLKIFDLKKILKLAKKYQVFSVVDNTFATPYFQNPLLLGADAVMHSTTKYIGGHSDVIGGAVLTNNRFFKEKMNFARMAIGLNPSPFDAWLTLRGLKTLSVRMEKHQTNAMAVAKFLAANAKVKKVYYPGLQNHHNHQIAKGQMSGYSGIVSVEFKLPLDRVKKLISSFKLFALAESLGGIESLVDHPASMTHASIPREERIKMGLADGLVRLSVGLEDTADLIADLKQGLAKV